MAGNRVEPVPIVCFASVDWDYLVMRHQQLMLRLARYRPVLYVEEQSHALSLLRDGRKVRKLWGWTRRPRLIRGGLYVLSPPIVLPFGRVFPWVNVINQRVVGAAVRRALRQLRFHALILWLYEPEQYALVGQFGERLVVYDCVDRHVEFQRLQKRGLVERMERVLCDTADVILVVSQALADTKPKNRTYLVPNGADVAFFEMALDPHLPAAPEVANLKSPILGYVGTVDTWVDVPLLVTVAKAFPKYSLVVVGPVRVDVGELRRLRNVRLLGPRRYENLPSYLKAFSVCLLPFKVNALTIAASPVKLYEYLAAGRVVVSTDIPEARRFHDRVFVATSREEFVQLIDQAVLDQDREAHPAATMEGHSWDSRAEQVEHLLREHLERKHQVHHRGK